MNLKKVSREAIAASIDAKGKPALLFLLYVIPFLTVLAIQLVYTLSWRPEDIDFVRSYPATEWLINYKGGFLRRGLPGSILYMVLEVLHLSPQVLTVLFATMLFALLCWYLFGAAHGMAPRWLLLTAPLLGYPVYVDYVLGRKDIFLFVLLALSLRLAMRWGEKWWSPPLVSLIMTIGLLSHESMVFFGLPGLVLMILLKAFSSASGPPLQLFVRQARRWVWLLVPVLGFACSVQNKGTLAQGQLILESVRSSLPPAARYLGHPGAIAFIGVPIEAFISDAHDALLRSHAGIPTWLLVIGLALSAVLLIAGVLVRRSEATAVFFVMACGLQFVCMAPLFYLAMDHGRWISISLMTAFLLTVESTLPMRSFVALCVFRPLVSFLHSIPEFLPPAGLAFWGAPIIISSLRQIFYSSPAGAALKVYFMMRVIGLPHPSRWWGLAG